MRRLLLLPTPPCIVSSFPPYPALPPPPHPCPATAFTGAGQWLSDERRDAYLDGGEVDARGRQWVPAQPSMGDAAPPPPASSSDFSYLAALGNCPLVAAALAFAIAHSIKVFATWYKENRWDAKQLVGSGGMPSSHSATVTALAIGVGLQEGFGSSLFATATIFDRFRGDA